MIDTKEELLRELAGLVDAVHGETGGRVALLYQVREALAEWFRHESIPLWVISVLYEAGVVVASLKGYGGEDDEEQYLAALAEMLEGLIEVQQYEPVLTGNDFTFYGTDELEPKGKGTLSFTCTRPLTAEALKAWAQDPSTGEWHSTLTIDDTRLHLYQLGAYGPA